MKKRFLWTSKKRRATLLAVALLALGSASAQEITLSKNNITLPEIFDSVYQQTGYSVAGAKALIQDVAAQDIHVQNMPLRQFLAQILQGQNLATRMEGKSIFVYRTEAKKAAVTNTAAQPRDKITLSGTIRDDKGQTVPNATIRLIGGQDLGVSSNAQGFFVFSNIPKNGQVSISAIGYESVSINLSGDPKNNPAGTQIKSLNEFSRQLNVQLPTADNALEDVVVTGYMDINKSKYVGSSFTVKADDIKIAGETSIDQMLQGVVPGMSVTMPSGQVGASAKIRVRGTSTLLGNQQPVWVVDGVIQRDPLPTQNNTQNGDANDMRLLASSAISWLNPNDIETITVLKDAAATAIYGSQAANGVIVIKTKKPKAGSVAISYNADMTVGRRPSYSNYDLMNSKELMQFSQEIYDNRNSYTETILPIGYGGLIQRLQNKEIDYDTYVQEYRELEGRNTDWFDLLFHDPISHNHHLNISGGSERIMNRTGIGFQKQIGEAKGNDQTNFTANSNTSVRFGEKLNLNILLNAGSRTADGFAYGVSPFDYAYNTARTIPMYNEDGSLFFHEKRNSVQSTAIPGLMNYLYNIQNELDNTGNTTTTRNIGATADLQYNITPELQFQSMFSYNVTNTTGRTYATELSNYITAIRGYEFGSVPSNSPEEHSTRLPFGGLIQTDNSSNSGYTFRNNLVYNKTFAEKHAITGQLGLEFRSATASGNLDTRYGYLRYRGEKYAPLPLLPDKTGFLGTSNVDDLYDLMREGSSITNLTSNYLSEYFTGVYAYDGRYIVNVSGRLDASNRFGQSENNRFAPTWSVGAKWRVGNEHFFQNQSWIGSLDLYGSYGFQGNAVEEVSPYLIANDGGLSQAFQQYILNIKSLPYPSLGWEKTRSWNFGADISFWNGRLNATANMFMKYGNILSSRDVPIENGMATAIVLGSKMENKGYDFIINVVPIRTQDFTWQFSVNSGFTRNRVLDNQRVNSREDYLSGQAIVNGQAYSTFYSWAYTGLNGKNGVPTFGNMDITPTDDPLDYLVQSGKLEPDFSGGFMTSLRYKAFTLSTQFAVAFGNQKRLPAIYASSGAPTPEQNVSRLLLDRWQHPGDEQYTDIPAVPPGSIRSIEVELPVINGDHMSPYDMFEQSDFRVANADFIRCRNISVRYEVPTAALKKLYVKRLSLSASLANPFLITFDDDWRGYDPETGGWPARRTGSLSVNLSF